MKLKKSPFLLIAGLSMLAVPAGQVHAGTPDAISLRSDELLVEFSRDAHQFRILDNRTGREWKTPAMNRRFKVAKAETEENNNLYLDFKDKESGLKYSAVVSLEKDILGFELSAKKPGASFTEIPYPAIPETDLEDGNLIFCNRGSGTRLPVETIDYPDRQLVVYANTGALDIPIFGIMEGDLGEGLMLLFETPTEASVNIVPNDKGIIEPGLTWFNTFGKFGYTRKVSLHFIAEGGYVSMAHRYRGWEEKSVESPTLRKKAEAREAVNWLKGATVVWGNIGGDIIKEGPVHGIRRMMLNGRFTIDLMEQAREQEYLLGEYDNYSDITDGELGPSKDNIEEAGLRGKDGELVLGWKTKEGKQYYNRSSRFAKRAAEAVLPELLEKYPYTARFLDVHSTIQFFEDYNPDHPVDRRGDMRYRQELYGYLAELGLVGGGEAAKAWCVPFVDYSEGNTSGSFYWFSDVGHLIPLEHRSDIPQAYLKFGMDPAYRVPLWELVYHDKVATTWYWGDSNGYFYEIAPEISDVKDAINILHGTMPLVWLDHLGYGWNRHRDRMMETIYTTARLHERIGFDAMTRHVFLSEDKMLQQTEFSSGAVVTVNFDKTPRKTVTESGEDLLLAPNGYLVEMDGHVQYKVVKGDAIETHIQNEEFLYIRTDAEQSRNIGPASITGELAAYRMPSGYWNIRYKSGKPVEIDLVELGVLAGGNSFRAVWINESGQFTRPLSAGSNGRLELPPSAESSLVTVLPNVEAVTPLIFPQEGQVTAGEAVSIFTDDPAVQIRYTLDGIEPCRHSPVYEGPIKLESGARMRAAAFLGDKRVSPVTPADLAVEVLLFESPVVRGSEAPVEVDINVAGLSELHIQVMDGKDGPHFDQAALGNARFISSVKGEISLTEYPPESSVRFDIEKDRNNYEGDPISIGGVAFEDGISSHAIDYIVYRLREDFTTFKASVGIHDRTTWKGPKGKKNGSVQFIFTGISNP